jgi:DNA-binding transcriptional LysR family regulator
MRFDLTTLNLVLAIADTRSITRGAERESLALAAASKRLSDLEARLGVSLFERHARGVEPTEAGPRAAAPHPVAERVAACAGKRGRRVLARHQGPPARGGQCQRHRRTPAGRPGGLCQAHPGIRVSLEELTSTDVQAAVAEGRADVGIFIAPAVEPSLRQPALPRGRARDPGAAWPCAGTPAGAAASTRLLDFDIVGLHAGAAAHEQMLQRAQALGRPLKARMQVHGFDAIAQLVEAGLGVAVLPAVVAHRFAKVFRVQPLVLQEDWAHRQYLLAVRRQAVLPPPLQRFIDTLAIDPSRIVTERPP